MQRLRDMIDRVARSQAPVHISGESGTGKELVARLIHDSGPRKDGPFVPVNCGAIPSELMESEFFGHRKGSFTGAVSDKTGLVQSANNGTLFLDEIADLPLAMQVKLLRVIQEQSVRPVGSSKEESVNVRFLSATHQDLGKRVRSADFREDLYYRINVIELHVPALRERSDDILQLADHILERLSGSKNRLDQSAKSALLRYAFPGNVRELENLLERAVTLCRDGTIRADDLAFRAGGPQPSPLQERPLSDLGGQLEGVERLAIIDALERVRYNKTAAAKILGLTFRQLRYRIKKLGIE
jgi:two-component system response regulator PilR (NtrC family)